MFLAPAGCFHLYLNLILTNGNVKVGGPFCRQLPLRRGGEGVRGLGRRCSAQSPATCCPATGLRLKDKKVTNLTPGRGLPHTAPAYSPFCRVRTLNIVSSANHTSMATVTIVANSIGWRPLS